MHLEQSQENVSITGKYVSTRSKHTPTPTNTSNQEHLQGVYGTTPWTKRDRAMLTTQHRAGLTKSRSGGVTNRYRPYRVD